MGTSKLNPFYRITFKSVKAQNLKDVLLKFKEGDLNIEIYPNHIYASSNNQDKISEIVKEIIPLTKVY